MKRQISLVTLLCFLLTGPGITPLYAQPANSFVLPAPGKRVSLSSSFSPAVLKGIKLDPKNPFQFHFFVDKADSALTGDALKEESAKLIKYFLASLTTSEKDLWVNLSPYEKDRVVPTEFGQTEMGRDLLAQDYLLKQITASLIYPEGEVGKKFWQKVYKMAQEKYGATNVPVNTFNKVWIVPEKAVVYENGGVAFVLENHLKVMLEEDYLSREKHRGLQADVSSTLGSQIVRDIVIPELTKEVNEGKNFAQLRQVFYSLILATWYKRKIKDSILNKVYSNRNKIGGVSVSAEDKNEIYQQYLAAFKKGVYNYIKEEPDPTTGQMTPRKYFSGGVVGSALPQMITYRGPADISAAQIKYLDTASLVDIEGNFEPIRGGRALRDTARLDSWAKPVDGAMVAAIAKLNGFFSIFQTLITVAKVGSFYTVTTSQRSKEPLPRKSFVSVTTPFDTSSFHFRQAAGGERSFDENDVIWEGEIDSQEFSLIKQNYPFADKQFLITPERLKGRPQVLQVKDIRLALKLLAAKPFNSFRIGFNSLMAGASVNHLHMHGVQLPEGSSPLEDAPLKAIKNVGGVDVASVEGYPARALFFSGNNEEQLTQVTYQYIRFLQRSEIAHNVIFTPKGIYVVPQKKETALNLGFYELMGFVINALGAPLEESLRQIIEHGTIEEEQFVASYHEAFNGQERGVAQYHPEHLSYKLMERRMTTVFGEVQPQVLSLLGHVDEAKTETRTMDNFPVRAVLNTQRASRQSAWEAITEEHDCPLCGLLAREHGHQLGIGHGFAVVPEQFPYFNNTATIVDMDHRHPVLDRGLTESMIQTLYELGPLGYRVGYNHRGAGQNIAHESYKVFPQKMPIEDAQTEAFLTFPDISVKVVRNFSTQAFVLETKTWSAMVNELVRMQEFLELMNTPFNILLTLSPDGIMRAYVMLRTETVPKNFNGKTFGVIESAGILLLENEASFRDPQLREKAIAAYKETTLEADEMKKLEYVYKMHMALGRLGIQHHLSYEIDTTGNIFFVSRVPEAGEVVKAMKLGEFKSNGQRTYKWDDFFTFPYELARKHLGDIVAPTEGVDINERGEFVPMPESPNYLIQQIVLGETAEDQLNALLQEPEPDIPAIMSIYETVIGYRAELARRGMADIDLVKYFINTRGDGRVAFDISHLRDKFAGTNIFGVDGYADDFEDSFNTYLRYMQTAHPLVSEALHKRFGSFFRWETELKRRGIVIPKEESQRPSVPMPDYHSRIVRLSQEPAQSLPQSDKAMKSETRQWETTNLKEHDPRNFIYTVKTSGLDRLLQANSRYVPYYYSASVVNQNNVNLYREDSVGVILDFPDEDLVAALRFMAWGIKAFDKTAVSLTKFLQAHLKVDTEPGGKNVLFESHITTTAKLNIKPADLVKEVPRPERYAANNELIIRTSDNLKVTGAFLVVKSQDDFDSILAISRQPRVQPHDDDETFIDTGEDTKAVFEAIRRGLPVVLAAAPGLSDEDLTIAKEKLLREIPGLKEISPYRFQADAAMTADDASAWVATAVPDDVFSLLSEEFVIVDPNELYRAERSLKEDSHLRAMAMVKRFDMFSVHGDLVYETKTGKAILITGQTMLGKSNITSRLIKDPRFSLRADDCVVAYFDSNGILQASLSANPTSSTRRNPSGVPTEYAPANKLKLGFVPVSTIIHLSFDFSAPRAQASAGKLNERFNDDDPDMKIVEDKAERIRKSDIFGINVLIPRGNREYGKLTKDIIKLLPTDKAMNGDTTNSGPGGIDLNPAQMKMEVQKGEEDFKFNFNGIEINASDITGAEFNILKMTPVTNLPAILGINS